MANNADYMIMGYAAMAILLFGMIAWTYYRFRMLDRESVLIDEFEAEERAEREAAGEPVSQEAVQAH